MSEPPNTDHDRAIDADWDFILEKHREELAAYQIDTAEELMGLYLKILEAPDLMRRRLRPRQVLPHPTLSPTDPSWRPPREATREVLIDPGQGLVVFLQDGVPQTLFPPSEDPEDYFWSRE